MRRVELAGKAIEEVAPNLRCTVQDCHVLPAEGDGPSPRTSFASDHPHPVLTRLDHATERSRGLSTTQRSCQDGRLSRIPTGKVCSLHPPKGPPNQQDGEPLQEVGFALGIGARQDVQARGCSEGKYVKVAEIRELYGFDLHPVCAPMRTQILMGMITQRDPSSSRLLITPGLNPSFTSNTICSPPCAPRASRT